MRDSPKIPISAQTAIHADLKKLLTRHFAHPYCKPYANYNVTAFENAWARYLDLGENRPLILDAGCGTGESSLRLLERFPNAYVMGVDQSAVRLQKRLSALKAPSPFIDWIRADLVDFWRLLAQKEKPLFYHAIFYPNPWPKIGHLARRWHGHAVFPAILQLGGTLECRSNWRIYAEELAFALSFAQQKNITVETFSADAPMSAFERKYQNAGHPLYRVCSR